jgi:putative sterol carrier protein
MEGRVREFFESLAERANGSHSADFDASYVFVVDGAGTWTVVVADGKVSVTEGDHGSECTFSTSEKTFLRIVDGQQNPLTAYMTGKLKVRGDVGAAMKLKDLLG